MMKKTIVVTFLFLIVALGFFVYFNSLEGEFVWDDYGLIRDNIYIRDFSHISDIFTEDITAGVRKESFSYRPLQLLTYIIDYSLWGLKPLGYHLTNLLLHILVTLGIFWFTSILFKDYLLSLFTAVLFIIHPIHTEAVSYISGRAEPLSTLFILLAFICYIKFIEERRFIFYLLLLVSFIFSLLSKESALMLPLLLLVYHWTFKRRVDRCALISIFIIAFVYSLLRLTVLYFGSYQEFGRIPFFQRLPGSFFAISSYIRLLFLPLGLHMEYGMRILPLNHPYVLLGVIMTILLLILAFLIRKTNRLVSFSISFFFITLIPVSNIYPINATMAEHWLYLPSVGFFMIIGWILSYLYKVKNLRVITIILFIGLVAVFSHLTIKQNRYWQEPISFYERTLKFSPWSSRLYGNLAEAYWQKGEYEKAVEVCKQAIKIDPHHFIAYNNLGNAYLSLGKYKKAESCFKKAISLDPEHPAPYSNLGWTYFLLGQYEQALILYKKSIELDANYSSPYYNLAILYYERGEYDLAVEYCRKAKELGHKIDAEFLDALKQHKTLD